MKTIATTVTLLAVSLASLASLGLSEILPGKAALLLTPLRVVASVIPFAAVRGASLAARLVPRAWQTADASPDPCRHVGRFMSDAPLPAGTSCAAHSALAGSTLPVAVLAALSAPDPPRGPRAKATAPATSTPAAPAHPGLSRNGEYWVESTKGVQTATSMTRLAIEARGSVTVRGDSEDGAVHYTLVKKVRAVSEAAARRALAQFKVQTSTEGDLTRLRFSHAGQDGRSAELTVSVPHALKEVIVQTHGGLVQAFDLHGSLKAETGGGRMELDRIDGSVSAVTAGGEIDLGSVGGSLDCRSAGGPIMAKSIGGEAALETAGGEISVGEAGGRVRASTAGGSIHIGKAAGDVVASTAGGTIDVSHARGLVTANNLGGPIQIGGAVGVRLESAGGSIRLNNVSGRLRAATVVGNIIASLSRGKSIEDSSLTTGGGDITVVIPANFPLTLRAENSSPGGLRRIVKEGFPEIRLRTVGALAVAEGRLNGGGPLLELSGTGGTITIKREIE